MRGDGASKSAPCVDQDAGRSGIGYGVIVAGRNIGRGVFDCNEPIDGGTRSVKTSEGDRGGWEEKGEQQWEEQCDGAQHEGQGDGTSVAGACRC